MLVIVTKWDVIAGSLFYPPMVVRGGLDARVVWTKPSYGGLVGAALGYIAALTPSLLPRALPFMIVVTAVGVVAGYAAGSAIEWFAQIGRASCRERV